MKIQPTEDQEYKLYRFVEHTGEEYDNLFDDLFGEQIEALPEDEQDDARVELEEYLLSKGLRF